MSLLTTVRDYARLGISNIVRVGAYRLALKAQIHPVQRLKPRQVTPPFFKRPICTNETPAPNIAWDHNIWWFGWYGQPLSKTPPDWFTNPFAGDVTIDPTLDWWKTPDFLDGDIKGIWELSRFDWMIAWATQVANDDADALQRLNCWVEDWVAQNPPYKGPNWKCGQEASIRVMHMAAAAWILGQDDALERGLADLFVCHLERIAPTMSYAIGQQNNHATSEAAALFIGGALLAQYDGRANRWEQKGRRWLENCARNLIADDGSFSQYSLNYHRVVLDTYSFCEALRRRLGLAPFSDLLYQRLSAATKWIYAMTDPVSGDVPNIGANDGARLFQFSGSDYRDYRPAVQLAAALFCQADAFGPGAWNAPLQWLGVNVGDQNLPYVSESFDSGGFHVLRQGDGVAVLRFPRFKFRPSQADALHVDFRHNGVNLLRDAGSYSYNADGAEWFAGTAAHNTIEFDGRNQMPSRGRFLFGSWLRSHSVSFTSDEDCVTATAGYTNDSGGQHCRELTLSDHEIVCQDTISGVFDTAVLQWRLAPLNWQKDGKVVQCDNYKIEMSIDGVAIGPDLQTIAESRYYQSQQEVPSLKLGVQQPATIITRITF